LSALSLSPIARRTLSALSLSSPVQSPDSRHSLVVTTVEAVNPSFVPSGTFGELPVAHDVV
jgi:hypothetical protein